MKTTTILTSFVAIALFAVRRSSAVVVRSQVNLSGSFLFFALSMIMQTYLPSLWIDPVVPKPSLPQQSGVPFSFDFKRHLDATSGERLCFHFLSCSKVIAVMVERDGDEKDVTGQLLYISSPYICWSSFRFLNLDAQVFNFALSLELLEREFYKHGLSRYSKEDFKKAGYPAWVRGRFEQIYEHERTHVQFLESALTAAGADYVKPCEYVLCVFFLPHSSSCFDCWWRSTFSNYNSPEEFIDLSEALETAGTSAYTGALQYISNDVGVPYSFFHGVLWDFIIRVTLPLLPLFLQQKHVMLRGSTRLFVNKIHGTLPSR